MRRSRPVLGRLAVRALLAIMAFVAGFAAIVVSDLDRYWPLDLRDPPGALTQWRLRLLAAEPQACLRTLQRSAVAVSFAPPRPLVRGCGYLDAVAASGGVLTATPVMRCATVAAYATWLRHVVQPAASRHLGATVIAVRTFGAYSCRDIAGRPGRRSQHATANAIDVAGFALSDGRDISVRADWSARGGAGAFLREIRDGACGLFAGVLSPDWNAAHADHFHLDMGRIDICR